MGRPPPAGHLGTSLVIFTKIITYTIYGACTCTCVHVKAMNVLHVIPCVAFQVGVTVVPSRLAKCPVLAAPLVGPLVARGALQLTPPLPVEGVEG